LAKPLKQVCIGLDWGTHSSKWWFDAIDDSGRQVLPKNPGGVVDSTIYRTGNALRLMRERTVSDSEIQDPRVKRFLLQDPQGASFWDAPREGIGISLGDAATLSLSVLLGDAISRVRKQELEIGRETKVSIVYSLPNWIGLDSTHQAARRRMFETTVVLAGLLGRRGFDELPVVNEKVNLAEWANSLAEIRASDSCRQQFQVSPRDFGTLVEREFVSPTDERLSWRLAPESSAAGFPQLLHLLMPAEEAKKAQDHWVKLLIVDVGAGSTDAGYFISSRRSNGTLLLNYLKPAPTHDYAGEHLTEMVKSFYFHKKHREITMQEAETIKLSAPGEWVNEKFAKNWRTKIAEHVGEYMAHVPDELRLGEPVIPGLKIVMTGGSGLVEGLSGAICGEVVEALLNRGIASNVAKRTDVSELVLDWQRDPVDRARRAVSIGAGSSTFGRLNYRERFEAGVPARRQLERW
jgi:hypothetical protein